MQIAPSSNTTQPYRMPVAVSAKAETADTNASAATSAASTRPATSTAAITANDFLQLLVTELQNQDPTANTDPNEYVNQLVQVNTLQQQIQMNQTLDGGPTLTGGSNGVLQELAQMNQVLQGDLSSAAPSAQVTRNGNPDFQASGKGTAISAGNLSATTSTQASAAAEAVATSLVRGPYASVASAGPSAFKQFAANLKIKPN